MPDRVVAVVQARLNSTRLPGKALLPVGDIPMVRHVLDRARHIPGVAAVVAAVPDEDTMLVDVLEQAGYDVYSGNHDIDDVLSRVQGAAHASDADVVVRLTGDCPLLATDVAAAVVQTCLQNTASFYAACVAEDGVIDGLDVEVMRRWVLDVAAEQSTDPADREHVTPWIRRNLLRVRTSWPLRFPFKLSVDTLDDLDRVRKVYEALPPGDTSLNGVLVAAARSGVWGFQ